LSSINGKSVEDVARILEGSKSLKDAYHAVAIQGDTSPPENPEDEVDYHYLCFAKDANGERLFEFDGDRSGPLERASLHPEEDLFSETALNVIRSYIRLEGGHNLRFGLMALAEDLAK
jgi:ubiquitin carboxyl-terminal hydrolase L3